MEALIRFGTRIDLIAFKGLNASGEEIEIVFIEIKTGRSGLSAVVCQKVRRRSTSRFVLAIHIRERKAVPILSMKQASSWSSTVQGAGKRRVRALRVRQ